jgi:hypothetical protein
MNIRIVNTTFLKVITVILFALSSYGSYAATSIFVAPDGNTYKWTTNTDGNNTATITGIKGSISNNAIVIPSTITTGNKTYTVTEIGSSAFNNTSITSVTFPLTLTKIDDHAFLECTSLTSITIPQNVTNIGIAAFRGCTNVKTINIDASASLQIDYGAFCTDNIGSLLGVSVLLSKGSLKKVFVTSATPPSLVNNASGLLELLEGSNIPYFSSGSKIYVPDATLGTGTASTQYKYKQAWSGYSSQIYKYFDKTLSGPYGDSYYGTLALPYAVEIPSDKDFFVVYTVSAIKKNEGISVASTAPVSSYIPANTGVILQNPQEAYTPRFLETTETVNPITGNKLQPCLDTSGQPNDKTSYLTLGRDKELLEKGQTVIGFYLYTGEMIACNTAYMLYSDAGAKSVTFSFDDDTPTSINVVSSETTLSDNKDVIYDLQGRRVTSPQKGIYIVNGKKVLY